ncbi:MAG: hypothetical protein WED33_11180 [Bacteroidia bacterium]
MTNFHLIWEKWLEKQNAEHRNLAHYYANLLLNVDHRIYPRMSYGASFLYRFGPIGYFNTDKQGLYFGFYWGKLLLESKGAELFEQDDRKMVKLVRLLSDSPSEDFIGNFLLLLESALEIDSLKYEKNRG